MKVSEKVRSCFRFSGLRTSLERTLERKKVYKFKGWGQFAQGIRDRKNGK